MIIFFQIAEFTNDTPTFIDYSWESDNLYISDTIFSNKKHKELTEEKPSGNYSEVKKYVLEDDGVTEDIIEGEERDTIKEHLNLLTSRLIEVDVKYYQNPLDGISSLLSKITTPTYDYTPLNIIKSPPININNSKTQRNTKPTLLFPTNIYIGHILNDGLYLSSSDFEIKYSSIAKKVENITKNFGYPSVKYTIKGNFFLGDREVILYEKGAVDADISISHLCTDGIHWKNITDYLSSRQEFELFEDSYLEKKYLLTQANSLLLPSRVSFIRVLCSAENKTAIVSLNVVFS